LRLSQPGHSIIIMDDTQMPHIGHLWQHWQKQKLIRSIPTLPVQQYCHAAALVEIKQPQEPLISLNEIVFCCQPKVTGILHRSTIWGSLDYSPLQAKELSTGNWITAEDITAISLEGV